MSAHTPGPWEAVPPSHPESCGSTIDLYPVKRYRGKDKRKWPPTIARMFHDNPNAYRNASLIAAAPDLLAACRAMLLDPTPRADAVRLCRAAIAKAEGGD